MDLLSSFKPLKLWATLPEGTTETRHIIGQCLFENFHDSYFIYIDQYGKTRKATQKQWGAWCERAHPRRYDWREADRIFREMEKLGFTHSYNQGRDVLAVDDNYEWTFHHRETGFTVRGRAPVRNGAGVAPCLQDALDHGRHMAETLAKLKRGEAVDFQPPEAVDPSDPQWRTSESTALAANDAGKLHKQRAA